MKVVKLTTAILFLVATTSILCGFLLDTIYKEKLIGFGVAGLFFVVFPLFIYYRWKDRDFKDYMLTQENLNKMRESQKKYKH